MGQILADTCQIFGHVSQCCGGLPRFGHQSEWWPLDFQWNLRYSPKFVGCIWFLNFLYKSQNILSDFNCLLDLWLTLTLKNHPNLILQSGLGKGSNSSQSQKCLGGYGHTTILPLQSQTEINCSSSPTPVYWFRHFSSAIFQCHPTHSSISNLKLGLAQSAPTKNHCTSSCTPSSIL